MHDDIKRFSLDGEIDSSNLVEEKERLIQFLETQMRDSGFVPALDLEPQFTRNYVPAKESYSFELSCYGIHVGKVKAWELAGIMGGKTIHSSITRSPKLSRS